MEKFHLKILNGVEVKEQYHVKITNGFAALENLDDDDDDDDDMDISRTWVSIRGNMKTSATESIGS
jgi:hypothetical protein